MNRSTFLVRLPPLAARTALAAILGAMVMLSGCSAIRPLFVSSPAPNYFALTGVPAPANAAPAPDRRQSTLIVSPPQAAAGFDSQRMMYMRKPDQLEYFAYNEWIDTPARMLSPLLVSALMRNGAFRAVLQTPSPAAGELRLETEILRLQQEFFDTPGQLRFGLRASLIESASRRVVASRDFEATVAVADENPQGGVVAANRAVQNVLEQLAVFCAEAARSRVAAGAPVKP